MTEVLKPSEPLAAETTEPQDSTEKTKSSYVKDGQTNKPEDSSTKPSEETPPVESKKPDVKAPKKQDPESTTPDVAAKEEQTSKDDIPEEKTSETKPAKSIPEAKTEEKPPEGDASKKPDVVVPDEETPKPEDHKAKAPDAEVKKPVANISLTETVADAVEGAVIGAGAAALRELTTKTAGDLENIEKGLEQELIAEVKHGLPSLAEIGEDIVDVVEAVGQEIVEGAEIVIKEVKAHPELIAEGAVAVAVGVASIAQPELIVGSVAMIGKMAAADRAKTTANEIAMEASTHVVNELSKDLNGELADYAKLEATTTKTDTIKTEKNVDEAAGTIIKKEIKQSVKETTIQIGTGEKVNAIKAEGDVEAPEGVKAPEDVDAKEKKGAAAEPVTSAAHKAPSTESFKQEAAGESEKTEGEGKHSSVVINSTTKTTSIKIDEDGTITIGTDAPRETKSTKIDEIVVKAADKVANPNEEGTRTDSPPKSATEVSKFLENKRNEALDDVAGQAAVEPTSNTDESGQNVTAVEEQFSVISTIKDSETTTTKSPELLIVSPAKPSSPAMIPESVGNGTHIQVVSALEDSLNSIHKKLDALNVSSTNTVNETTEEKAPTVDSHIQESLAQVHQKLDGIISSRTKETQDTLPEESKEVSTTSTKNSDEHVLKGAVEKIHIKLDELLLSNAEVIKAAATRKEQDSELATQKALEKLHEKLDKMQEALAIEPNSEESFVPVHAKMDAIHEAILSGVKPAHRMPASEETDKEAAIETAKHLESLHKKFEAMQASIDKLTEALTIKRAAEVPAFTHPAAILTPEPSGISEPVQPTDSTQDVPEPVPTSEETSATTPILVDELAKAVTSAPKVTESTAEPNDVAKKDNGVTPTDTETPKSPSGKKHVKRSSFFGGFFG